MRTPQCVRQPAAAEAEEETVPGPRWPEESPGGSPPLPSGVAAPPQQRRGPEACGQPGRNDATEEEAGSGGGEGAQGLAPPAPDPRHPEAVLDTVPRAVGIDVHKMSLTCTVLVEDDSGRVASETRQYRTYGAELRLLVGWLAGLDLSRVVMESTGVFWKSVQRALSAAGVEVWVANARHVKVCPSFVAPPRLEELRRLTRLAGVKGNARKKIPALTGSDVRRHTARAREVDVYVGEHVVRRDAADPVFGALDLPVQLRERVAGRARHGRRLVVLRLAMEPLGLDPQPPAEPVAGRQSRQQAGGAVVDRSPAGSRPAVRIGAARNLREARLDELVATAGPVVAVAQQLHRRRDVESDSLAQVGARRWLRRGCADVRLLRGPDKVAPLPH